MIFLVGGVGGVGVEDVKVGEGSEEGGEEESESGHDFGEGAEEPADEEAEDETDAGAAYPGGLHDGGVWERGRGCGGRRFHGC